MDWVAEMAGQAVGLWLILVIAIVFGALPIFLGIKGIAVVSSRRDLSSGDRVAWIAAMILLFPWVSFLYLYLNRRRPNRAYASGR